MLKEVLADHEARLFLKVNSYDGVLWYNKEAFDLLCDWLFIGQVFTTLSKAEKPFSVLKAGLSPARKSRKKPARQTGQVLANARPAKMARSVLAAYEMIKNWRQAEKKSAYQVENLLRAAAGRAPRTPAKKAARSKSVNASPRTKGAPKKSK